MTTPCNDDALLAPIAGVNRTGRDMRGTTVLRAIREARCGEEPSFPSVFDPERRDGTDWPRVERLCREVLATETKDLMVATWLAEAWVRRDGIDSAARGLTLIERLLSTFEDDLFPRPEGMGNEARANILSAFDERMRGVLSVVPLTTLSDGTAVTLQSLQQAARIERGDVTTRRTLPAEASLDRLMAGLATVPPTRRIALRSAIAAAYTALATLDATMEALLGDEAPSMALLRVMLERIEALVPVDPPRADIAVPSTPDDETAPVSEPELEALTPDLRAAAYSRLDDIAETLRALEPHSPVPAILERVRAWERLSLADIDARLQETGSGIGVLVAALRRPD